MLALAGVGDEPLPKGSPFGLLCFSKGKVTARSCPACEHLPAITVTLHGELCKTTGAVFCLNEGVVRSSIESITECWSSYFDTNPVSDSKLLYG